MVEWKAFQISYKNKQQQKSIPPGLVVHKLWVLTKSFNLNFSFFIGNMKRLSKMALEFLLTF